MVNNQKQQQVKLFSSSSPSSSLSSSLLILLPPSVSILHRHFFFFAAWLPGCELVPNGEHQSLSLRFFLSFSSIRVKFTYFRTRAFLGVVDCRTNSFTSEVHLAFWNSAQRKVLHTTTQTMSGRSAAVRRKQNKNKPLPSIGEINFEDLHPTVREKLRIHGAFSQAPNDSRLQNYSQRSESHSATSSVNNVTSNESTSHRSSNDKDSNNGSGSAMSEEHKSSSFDERSLVLHEIHDPLQNLRCWKGGSAYPEPWNKLAHDPELWDPKGDTLITLPHLGSFTPSPSFRINSHSLLLLNLDYFNHSFSESSLNSKAPSMVNKKHNRSFSMLSTMAETEFSDLSGNPGADLLISHSLTLTIPEGIEFNSLQVGNVTLRNIIAMAYNKSIVGTSLLGALKKIMHQFRQWTGEPHIGQIIQWLSAIDMHNVTNNPEAACDILIWSEMAEVRWLEGWKEAFIHCVGMYRDLKKTSHFAQISDRTKAMLKKAHHNVMRRMVDISERLECFDFSDCWIASDSVHSCQTSRTCFDNLAAFFARHYQEKYNIWPPLKRNDHKFWLTRRMIKELDDDFSTLYMYLVDRNANWINDQGLSDNTIHYKGAPFFCADTPDLSFTKILEQIDNKYNCEHIPLPYPLIPIYAAKSAAVQPPISSAPAKQKKLLKKILKQGGKETSKDELKEVLEVHDEQVSSLSYGDASNIMDMPSTLAGDLLSSFVEYEASLDPSKFNPYHARRGHWLLIYGILQLLSRVSVDAPGVKFPDEALYPLCCRMEQDGYIWEPFKNSYIDLGEGNLQDQSFCWRLAKSWNLWAKEIKPEGPYSVRPFNSEFSQSTTTFDGRMGTYSSNESAVNMPEHADNIRTQDSPPHTQFHYDSYRKLTAAATQYYTENGSQNRNRSNKSSNGSSSNSHVRPYTSSYEGSQGEYRSQSRSINLKNRNERGGSFSDFRVKPFNGPYEGDQENHNAESRSLNSHNRTESHESVGDFSVKSYVDPYENGEEDPWDISPRRKPQTSIDSKRSVEGSWNGSTSSSRAAQANYTQDNEDDERTPRRASDVKYWPQPLQLSLKQSELHSRQPPIHRNPSSILDDPFSHQTLRNLPPMRYRPSMQNIRTQHHNHAKRSSSTRIGMNYALSPTPEDFRNMKTFYEGNDDGNLARMNSQTISSFGIGIRDSSGYDDTTIQTSYLTREPGQEFEIGSGSQREAVERLFSSADSVTDYEEQDTGAEDMSSNQSYTLGDDLAYISAEKK